MGFRVRKRYAAPLILSALAISMTADVPIFFTLFFQDPNLAAERAINEKDFRFYIYGVGGDGPHPAAPGVSDGQIYWEPTHHLWFVNSWTWRCHMTFCFDADFPISPFGQRSIAWAMIYNQKICGAASRLRLKNCKASLFSDPQLYEPNGPVDLTH